MSPKSTPLPSPPELLATTESVDAFTAWVASQALAGKVPPVLARELNQMARTTLASIRVKAGLDEMDKLRRMLDEALAVVEARKASERDARYDQGSELGEFETEE